jgi:Domain of Unknown Function (DUF1080)
MRYGCASLFLALSSLICNAQEAVPLFNEKDLTGWVLVNTPPETWSVQDKMLICTGKPIGEIRTERMYQNFELELEWRHLVPRGNAGVFVWADDITSRGVPFHRSIEVQVLENAYGSDRSHTTHGDIFPIHGAEMTPINGRGGSRAFPTEERSKPSPQWNHYRIVCNDGAISLAVNGKVVTQGKDASPRKGYICLESEGGIVHYRNLRIKELPATPIDAKHVAISHRGFRSIYTGLNLNGWKTNELVNSAWHAEDWKLTFSGTEQANRLETGDSLQIAGMILDFRFVETSKGLSIELPGDRRPLIINAEADPLFAGALVKRGNWNRLEMKLENGELQGILNGHSHALPHKLGSGALAIQPIGPIELANIFVR